MRPLKQNMDISKLIPIPDYLAAFLKIEWKVKHARIRVRDEKTLTTYVSDRLLGL